MKEMQIMKIEGIEGYEKDGIAYLKLETVARGLGFTRIADSGNEVIRWERVEKYLNELGMPTCGHDSFIPENIFYRLAMKAKNETAEKFQAKIADEVIPAIRKTGKYEMQPVNPFEAMIPKDYPSALRALADKVEENEQLKAENEIQKQIIADYKPKVDYYQTILSSQDSIAVTQIAADYGITAQALNKILYEEGIQHKVGGQWVLYKSKMGMGYTDSETIPIYLHDGKIGHKVFTRWKMRGRLLIHGILESRGIHPVMDMVNQEEISTEEDE